MWKMETVKLLWRKRWLAIIPAFLLASLLRIDSISGDISSKWTYLTLSRCSNRSQWWLSKVASIYTAALIYSAVGVLIVFLVSLTQLPYGGTLSAFATNPPDLFKAIGTYVIPKNMNPFVLTGQLVLYTSFALGTFCIIPVFLSMIIPKTHIEPTVSLVYLLIVAVGFSCAGVYLVRKADF